MIKYLLRIFCALLGTFVSTGADAAEKQNSIYLMVDEWGDFESGHIGQPNDKPYERKNFLKQIRARQKGDAAWVSYWNRAKIRRGPN